MRSSIIIVALAIAPTAARAEVVTAAPAGFEVKEAATIAAPPEKLWPVLMTPQHWWSSDHTWSGDAANLYMDHQATGCFCEKLPNKGSVEHARLIFVDPGKTLRMTGALGPLQAEAATGTLTITLAPDGDGATKVTFDYIVGGYIRAGAEGIAPAVDAVLAQQLAGLKAAAEAAPAAPAS